MLTAALEAEVESYLAEHANTRDETRRRLVVRNGHGTERSRRCWAKTHRGFLRRPSYASSRAWETDFEEWSRRDLSSKRYVRIWADGNRRPGRPSVPVEA